MGEREDKFIVAVDCLGCREPVGYKEIEAFAIEAFALQEGPEGDTRKEGIVSVELP